MLVVASDDVSSVFVSSELVPAVKVLLTDSNTLAEILCNVLTLVISISKSRESPQLHYIEQRQMHSYEFDSHVHVHVHVLYIHVHVHVHINETVEGLC